MDPFDLFEMFFTGNMQGNMFHQRGNRVFRRQQHEHQRRQEHHGHQQQRANPRQQIFIQLLPFLIILLFTVVPYFFQTVKLILK